MEKSSRCSPSWGLGGGLGKTTLAMEVCRQLEVEFDRQAQVSVSQMFDVGKDLKELLKRVLRQIAQKKESNDVRIQEEDPLRGIDTLDADQLASMLHDLLHDKRYIIYYILKAQYGGYIFETPH
jgi:disease resistance protein RPM1